MNESVTKINYNKWHNNLFFAAISILVTWNYTSFRVLFDEIASVYFIWKKYIYILALEMASSGNQHCANNVSAHFRSLMEGMCSELRFEKQIGTVMVATARIAQVLLRCSCGLEWSANDLRMIQLMLYPPLYFRLSKNPERVTLLVPDYRVCPGKEDVKRAWLLLFTYRIMTLTWTGKRTLNNRRRRAVVGGGRDERKKIGRQS